MAVVIDEVEVEAEEPREKRGGGGESDGGAGAAQQPPKPEDVGRAMRAQSERAERVWAH